MDFTLTNFIFYGFALMTVGSALLVVTVRNIVHAAFSLMVTLFGVAGLYVFLQADFLAATQGDCLCRRYSRPYLIRCHDDKWTLGDAHPY